MKKIANMLDFSIILLFVSCLGWTTAQSPIYVQPEQIHLSYGEDPAREMTVTWSTHDQSPLPVVYFGRDLPNVGVTGHTRHFVDGGNKRLAQFIHRVRLSGLRPNTDYVYRCGSELGWSNEFSFRTANESGNSELRIAAYGDMGSENAQSLPALQLGAQTRDFHAVLHIGDFAYDMDSEDGKVGDQFMRQIEPVAAYVPYMTCPGNHEQAYNFSHYRERFSMPGGTEGLFYSFNLGPVHFIGINTEAYFFLEYGLKLLVNQYNWLVNDLKEANRPESREQRPWIVTFGHRPMYCSNWYPDNCALNNSRIRVGLPGFEWFGLEKLFYDHGVDLELWGHEHSYERLWPIYDYQVKNGSNENPYINPKAPVQITSGSAGCNEFISNFTKTARPWSAFRSEDYGYLMLHFLNNTHLHLQQLAAEKTAVVDDIWIVKDKHGKYS